MTETKHLSDEQSRIMHLLKERLSPIGSGFIFRQPEFARQLIIDICLEDPDIKPSDIQETLRKLVQPQYDALFAPITDEEMAGHRSPLESMIVSTDSPPYKCSDWHGHDDGTRLFMGPIGSVDRDSMD